MTNRGYILDTPDQINAFRLLSLRGALKLEIRGMKRRGPSAASIIKREFKLKGNNVSVLTQYEVILREMGVLSGPDNSAT